MALIDEAYSKKECEQIRSFQSQEKTTTEAFRGKMAHQAQGVVDLKKFSDCKPVQKVITWKAPIGVKVYEAKFAKPSSPGADDDRAPFACCTEVCKLARQPSPPGRMRILAPPPSPCDACIAAPPQPSQRNMARSLRLTGGREAACVS